MIGFQANLIQDNNIIYNLNQLLLFLHIYLIKKQIFKTKMMASKERFNFNKI